MDADAGSYGGRVEIRSAHGGARSRDGAPMDQFLLHRHADGEATLTCRGDLDLMTHADLGAACYDAVGLATRRLHVDLDGVDFIDCASIRLLDQTALIQERQGGEFVVVCSNEFLRRVLRLTGFSARHGLFQDAEASSARRVGRLSWRVPAPPSARRAAR